MIAPFPFPPPRIAHPDTARARQQMASLGGNPDVPCAALTRDEYLWRLGANLGVEHLMEMAGLRQGGHFDAGKLLTKYPIASSGEKHILVFLTELADGRPGVEGLRFDVLPAICAWDPAVRRTFATWLLNPFFP